MKLLNFIQGSPEWHQHRAEHFNASDAPAMLGISKYETRTQLLHRMATGITPEIDAATQKRFNDGHRFEALARPIAEEIIGDDLYPVVGSEGIFSASFDGLTDDGKTCFEHKTLNNNLLEAINSWLQDGEPLPEEYRVQMEQQLMISEASRCLFMISVFDEADRLVGEEHCYYSPDHELRQRIFQGWAQFAIDLEEYKRKLAAGEIEQPKEKPVAEAIMDLPALSVQATGMVTHSNLPEFKKAAETYIANINTSLQTDQDFADAEAMVKFCKATEDKLEVTKSAILAQTATIDEVIRTVNNIQEQLSKKRIMLNNLVSKEKDARKLAIVSKAGNDFTAYVQQLEIETRPIQLNVPRPDFAVAIKGMKKLSAMQDAVDTVLRNGKFEADQISKDIRAKLSWYNEATGINNGCYGFLFADLNKIINKPMDDFKLAVTSRIESHQKSEAEKLAAERARMEAEAKAKAEREAQAKLSAENKQSGGHITQEIARAAVHSSANLDEAMRTMEHARPTKKQMIEVIAKHYGVSFATADEWFRNAI